MASNQTIQAASRSINNNEVKKNKQKPPESISQNIKQESESRSQNIKQESESRSQNIKQELTTNNSKANDDGSSWNVVVTKRQNSSHSMPSSTPKTSGTNGPKHHSQKKAGGPKNSSSSNKQKHQKQQLPQQFAKTKTKTNNTNTNNTHEKNANNRKAPPKNTNVSNENTHKKGKPKPKAVVTVGDMIPVSKKKEINKDSNKKIHPQQQQPKTKGQQSNGQSRQNSYQRKPQPPHAQAQTHVQDYAGLNTNSVQHFPSLGSSSIPTPPMAQILTPPKTGWGAVPKVPNPSTTFRAEPNPSNHNNRAQNNNKNNNNRQSQSSQAFKPTQSWAIKSPKQPNHLAPNFVGTSKQPSRVLKRGEALPSRGSALAMGAKGAAPRVPEKKKSKSSNVSAGDTKTKTTKDAPSLASSFFQPRPRAGDTKTKTTKDAPSLASSFFQPRPRDIPSASRLPGAPGRQLDGEEHQLLRLVQERNVYQKKGRQRVAPRKKKFTALKKKVLQERLDQWRALHPEEVSSVSGSDVVMKSDKTMSSPGSGGISMGHHRTRSLCLYNYAELDELEDDDEYEEILQNLTSMATKIGPIEQVFIPRKIVQTVAGDASRAGKCDTTNPDGSDSDQKYRHPVFVLFQKEADASAALACWCGWVIGGSELEVSGLEMQDQIAETLSDWPERVLTAVSMRHNGAGEINAEGGSRTAEILLQKVLTEEDYEDDDCMKESLEDLKKIALQFGALKTIQAAGNNGDVLVTFDKASLEETRSIAEDLCRVVVGGQPLYASVRELPADPPQGLADPSTKSSTLLLENVLTEDDLQDSDCLQESLNDIKELCLRYGSVSDVVAKGSSVKLTYQDDGDNIKIAQTAASELDGIVLGGNTVRATVLQTLDSDDNHLERSVDLHNLVTEDDLGDEECMEESLDDVRKLASNYGEVESVSLCKGENDAVNDPSKAYVRIRFSADDPSVVAKALEGFRGMVIGGQIISVSRSAPGSLLSQSSEMTKPGGKRKPGETPQSALASEASDIKKARTDDKAPLYSGDKLISERFAAMKRVPKIPNEGPRAYASNASTDERIKPLLSEMLRELMRLQKRAIEDKNTKARRRMVMGLREVARGIRSHKVKMVVMANNLDQYGVIDKKLQEIIDLAKSEGVPLFFEFTKRSLGKAIGKSIKIAVVGIQNADGAYQPFKKLNTIAGRM